MTWLGAVLIAAAVLAVAALLYWQLVIAEGTYLGSGVVAKTYDWVARRYDAIKQFNPSDERWFLARPLMRTLTGLERPRVLDVATGTGRLPVALLRERFAASGGYLVGLDLSRGMLRQARAKLRPYGQAVGLIWQDAAHLPFEAGTFDAVTCLESLEFMPRPHEVLAEMVRVLAPGGVLILTNRVGREARLMPGRAFPRPEFKRMLEALPLADVQVRAWQVNYDLASARRAGAAGPPGNGDAALADLLRCPACEGGLQRAAGSLRCQACEQTYPIHDGIVHLANTRRRSEL